MADTDLQAFLSTRQEALTSKFEAGNVEAILEHYDEKEVDFSDHGTFFLLISHDSDSILPRPLALESWKLMSV